MQNLANPHTAPVYTHLPGDEAYMIQSGMAWPQKSPATSETSYWPHEMPLPQEPAGLPPPEAKQLIVGRASKYAFFLVDLCMTVLGVLFLTFGWLVFKADGSNADSKNSWGRRLDRIAQYTPTVFPVLFGAALGGALRRYATFRVQTRSGISVATLEQYIGSQSIYRAVATHVKLRSVNLLGVFILLLWCLSPLGGQAALRVIRLVSEQPASTTGLYAMQTFQEYQYGFALQAQESLLTVKYPTVAAIMSASLLNKRNQDLWGNVRLPSIEMIEQAGGTNSSSNDVAADGPWLDVPTPTNLTYPSLVGVPVNNLSASGTNQFVLPGSYLAVSCPVYGLSAQTTFTNYTAENVTEPGGDFDCTWYAPLRSTMYLQLAVSLPCADAKTGVTEMLTNEITRPARRLIWESLSSEGNLTRAECLLTTTYVEADVNCTANSSPSTGTNSSSSDDMDSSNGSSGSSTCTPSRVRRSRSSHVRAGGFDSNWTVLDAGTTNDASALLYLVTMLFSESGSVMEALDPIPVYMAFPFHAVGASVSSPYDTVLADTVDVTTFELRLAQVLNTILIIGTVPQYLTGAFNTSAAARQDNSAIFDIPASVIAKPRIIVHYSPVWLVFLTICSLAVVLTGIFSGVLHLFIIAPDVLETIAVAFLPNRLGPGRIAGNSTWSGSEWARKHKHVRLVLGDVAPDAEAGRIGLTTVGNQSVAPLKLGRWYM
ncbi:hypothetical protein CMQ_1483 [Grosmannia clavigera kw1407]|uniref:Uncharacterized protein n=1 Tax=Grosmannia clavigera (strain kw1407 / UAMH 11150) TaxID=655863 RepID=F0XE77_GROCL|nr:uncharacterized protein CMQ_1483 [Grosmannia clavigera kw1407]EFX04555.1 hypothetical protein CMQ_1483 [Grosmannia clavigera kw1407]